MASANSQPKTRVEQDIENWKKQQLQMNGKGAAGANAFLFGGLGALAGIGGGNGLQYSGPGGLSGLGGSGGGAGANGHMNAFDSCSQMSRKKRRRKRNKSNKQRVKSFLSSSSGCEDQLNESMIESCSSPDYSMQEMELGKEFFTDSTTKPGMATATGTPQIQPMLAALSIGKGPSSIIEKLRQTLKETGHIIEVKAGANAREKAERQQRFQSLTKKEFSADPAEKAPTPPGSQPDGGEAPMMLD